MNRYDVVIAQTTQASCLLAELVPLTGELLDIGLVAYADRQRVIIALADATHKELLDGHLLLELQVGSDIGVAKTT